MILRGIGATTEIDRHNSRFTKQALENAANSINTSGSVPLFGLNHNRTIMPFGKVISAEVLPMSNGEYKLEFIQEIFEEEFVIEAKDGTNYIMNKSSIDDRPFTEETVNNESYAVSLDMVNFSDYETAMEMKHYIEKCNMDSKDISRKSFIPDPEIIFQISSNIVGILLCKKVIDSIGDQLLKNLLNEVDNFYNATRNIVVKYSKLVIPKNRPQTYVFKLWDECIIELVVVTTSANIVMESIERDNIKNIEDKLNDLKTHFSPNRVQFVYEDGKWEFNYLCTDKGEVVGTERSYNKRVKEFDLFKSESEKLNLSVQVNIKHESV